MSRPLLWLQPTDDFPTPSTGWEAEDTAPGGLLAAGGALSVDWLLKAYSNGVFPWFSEGDPILWWSPDPRMVLQADQFRVHKSLRQAIKKFTNTPECHIRINSRFDLVIHACATTPRLGQNGTWILPAMVDAYLDLHRAGFAHSIEVWVDDSLVGGLYFVNLGRSVFGESMFAHQPNASKIALAALVAMCIEFGVESIDCQQQTHHLATLGARPIQRCIFLQKVKSETRGAPIHWQFDSAYWQNIGL
jgi:leucyl/phenylalanyl-tRNA--protein transferase